MASLKTRIRELHGFIQQLLEHVNVTQRDACAHPELSKFSLQELRVLAILGQQDGCNMRRLSEGLGLPYSTATGIVDKLVDKELLKRDRDAGDRRVVRLYLTEKGHSFVELEQQRTLGISRSLLEGLSAEEQETMLKLFQKAVQNLEKA